MPAVITMPKIIVEVNKDTEGYPTQAIITIAGRKAEVTFDSDRGFRIEGPRVILPDFSEIMRMIYPANLQTIFNIPEPLQVTVVTGGKVIFYDDLSDLLKWDSAQASQDNSFAFEGANSLLLDCAAAATSETKRYFPMPPSKKISLSSLWVLNDYDKITNGPAFRLQHFDGLGFKIAEARYNDATKNWSIIGPGGAYSVIPSSDLAVTYDEKLSVGGPWHKIKLTADFQTAQYINFEANGRKISLANQPLYVDATPAQPRSYVSLRATCPAAPADIWFDCITVMEE